MSASPLDLTPADAGLVAARLPDRPVLARYATHPTGGGDPRRVLAWDRETRQRCALVIDGDMIALAEAWSPQLAPPHAIARRLDRHLQAYVVGAAAGRPATLAQRARAVGVVPTEWGMILAGRGSLSMRRVAAFVERWNGTAGSTGPQLRLDPELGRVVEVGSTLG
jgi:hypothetical protein